MDKKMFQNDGSAVMHPVTDGKFQGFQIETSLFLPVPESQSDQRLGFALDLSEDLGFCFFWRDSISSAPSSCSFKSQISWLV
jgi:hypothetical protein